MSEHSILFVSLAEIAGVFVGFGALIASRRRSEMEPVDLVQVRGVVSSGLIAVIAALVPALVELYGFSEPALTRISSSLFLALIWIAILSAALVSANSPYYRQQFFAAQKANPAGAILLLILELPIQLTLLLNVVGFQQSLGPAFYGTALVLNLLQAALFLVQLVVSDRDAE